MVKVIKYLVERGLQSEIGVSGLFQDLSVRHLVTVMGAVIPEKFKLVVSKLGRVT